MASSVSGQDEPNRTLWLATRAGKIALACPHGTTRCILQEKFPRKPYNKSFIDQVCSVKMAGYWPRSFFARLWTSTSSRPMTRKKRTWPISSYLDWSSSVNSPYIQNTHRYVVSGTETSHWKLQIGTALQTWKVKNGGPSNNTYPYSVG